MTQTDSVTKGELDETLEKALKPYATKKYLDKRIEKLEIKMEQNVELLVRHIDKMGDKILNRSDQLILERYQMLRGASEDQLSVHEDLIKRNTGRIEKLESAQVH